MQTCRYDHTYSFIIKILIDIVLCGFQESVNKA